MNSNNKKKIEKLKSLILYINKYHLIEPHINLNPTVITNNANILNSIIHDIYLYHCYKTAKDTAKYINKKYDADLDEDVINKVWDDKYFMSYMDVIYKKQTKMMKDLEKIQNKKYKIKGGNNVDINNLQPLDNVNYTDNIINIFFNSLNDKEFIGRSDVIKIINELPIFKAYINKDWDNLSFMISDYIISLHPERAIEFILFPLYYVENMEGTGPLNSIIVDMVGMWINFVDIFVKFITPVFLTFLQTTITASAAVPGVGTATAPLAASLELIEEPLQFFLMGLPTFFKMLFTIQRKEFKQALSDMVNIFPMLGVAIVAATNYMTSANKILYLMASNLDTTYMNIDSWKNMSINDFNKVSSFDLEKIYEIFIKPNEDRIPFLKNGLNLIGLDDMMSKYKYEKTNILDKYSNISSLDKASNILEKGTNILEDKASNILERGTNILEDRASNILEKGTNVLGNTKNLLEDKAGNILEKGTNVLGNTKNLLEDKAGNILEKGTNVLGNTKNLLEDTTNILTERIKGGNKIMKDGIDEFMNKFINIQNDIKNLI
jgi:hypothetical protein